VEKSKNNPTPNPTVFIKISLDIEGTCVDKTLKSGSAIVIINPIIKLNNRMKEIFLFFVRLFPILEPISIIDMSAPILNNVIPKINKTDPIKNAGIKLINEASKKITLIINTMIVIGIIDFTDEYI
jgi:hypothetical protein